MANPTNTVNLDLTGPAYQAVHAARFAFKVSEDTALDESDIPERSAAEWPNGSDDAEIAMQVRMSGLVLNARELGLLADGSTVETATLQAAVDAARSVGAALFIPSGTTVCDAQINAEGVEIVGAPGAVISFAGALEASFPDNACIYAEGSLGALPALNADVSAGDTSIVFASDVSGSLSAESVFAIYDPTDSSFNPARPEYRAGEWCRVVSVSGATVVIDRPLRADYAAATVNNFALTPTSLRMDGVDVVGIGTTDTVAVVRAVLAESCAFANMTLSGSQFSHLLLDRVVGGTIERIRARDYGPLGNTNYGISLDSVRDVHVDHCRIAVRRHAITLGCFDVDAAVPNRDVIVDGCILTGTDHAALDAHGCSEDYQLINSRCYGGIQLGGDRARVAGCFSHGSSVGGGVAIRLTETIGADFTIEDNELEEQSALASGRGLLDWGGNTDDAIVVAARAGGRFKVTNNRFRLRSGLNAMVLRPRGTFTDDINATIKGNRAVRPTTSQESAYLQVAGSSDTSSYWREVVFENNHLDGVGVFANGTGAETIQVHGGTVRNSGAEGVRVTDDAVAADFPWGGADGDQRISVRGVSIRDSWLTGIHIGGWHEDISSLKMVDNVSMNNSRVGSGSAVLRSSAYIQRLLTAEVRGNSLGDNQAVATQVRTWAADTVDLLIEGDNTSVGALLTSVFTNIGRQVSRVFRLGSGSTQYQVEGYGTAAPTAGTWNVGDRVWNSAPAVGNPVGWMCTVAGSPGTWVAMANL